MRNNHFAKVIRTITSVLSIEKSRNGSCKQCGACCKLPNPCNFLGYDENNKAICRIYRFRPLNCRKYPRSIKEHITKQICGFYFEND